MIIAAWGNDTGGSAAGAVYLVNGPISGDMSLVDADRVLVGEDPVTMQEAQWSMPVT